MFYRVRIEKQRRESRFDASYRWQVEAYKDSKEDTRQEWELRGVGYTYRVGNAKKKALKHISGVERDLEAGLKFGVLVTVSGTAEEIKEALR